MTTKRPANDRGIVVMAYGSARYLRQARSLALSLDHNSPGIPRTLITDRPNHAATRHYDTVIRLAGPASTDCRPKLDLDQYTPYRRTLYIDADSLVIRHLEPILAGFTDEEFVVIGKNVTTGHWYGDVPAMRRLARSPSLPKFNGGFIYFADTPRAVRVFAHARRLADDYDTLGFDRFNHGIADEPLLAVALAAAGLTAYDLTHSVMATPLGATGPLTVDVLAGVCRFSKRGRAVRPAILHFAADYSSRHFLRGAHYRRERHRLDLVYRLRLPAIIATILHAVPCSLVKHLGVDRSTAS